ncbi:MAG TPA: glycosyl hydrolase, partial [Chitinophagaceae bacterium]|nr:glycosyl hydrolase [Chitinophagaceae bacterium]
MAQKTSLHLIDKLATSETKALYKNLYTLSQKHILFGHQHATEYGHGWSGEEGRSDVRSVTGSHPAVIGVDFSGLSGRSQNEIEKTKTLLRKTITDTYNRGGVTTVSWHFNNPLSPGGFYWIDTVSKASVKYLIPGGEYHNTYKETLNSIADFVKSVKGKDGEPVPMIFRPFHEFDGYWFWWGRNHCTTDDFVSLWKFTVSY